MYKLYFLIGASGSGKTTLAKILEKNMPDLQFCYFDSIGVPHESEMIKEYGSADGWQRAKTIEWVDKIGKSYIKKKDVILDGQIRPSFIEEACKRENFLAYEIILIDCKDEVRRQRLIGRGHPELANDKMMNWANYLRKESISRRCRIIDTSNLTLEQGVSSLIVIIKS